MSGGGFGGRNINGALTGVNINKETIANARASKDALGVFNTESRALTSRQNWVAQNRMAQGMALNNGGQTFGGIWNSLAHTPVLDENGDPTNSILGSAMSLVPEKLQGITGIAGAIGAGFLGNLGNFLNGDSTLGDASERAAIQAGAFSEAQNRHQRNQIVAGANSAYDTMNLQNEGNNYALAGNAINNASNYEMGQQAIGMSGIEGGNMQRNLDYGMDSAEANTQLEYMLMGNQAQGVNSAMASSFDQLSQNTARLMGSTLREGLMGEVNALNAGRTQLGQFNMQHQVTANDYTNLLAKTRKARKDEELRNGRPDEQETK